MKNILYILFITFSNFLFAQFEKNNGNTINLNGAIGTISTPSKPAKKPKSLEFDNSYNGFKTAKKRLDKNYEDKLKKQALNNKGIIKPEDIAKERYKKNFEGKFQNFPLIDMDLGSFHTNSKNINISSYDFGVFDGDKVQITINGERFHNNYVLTPSIKTISIPLKLGINKVEITAINEGRLSPNTGYFAFFDDNKQVIKKGEWMLATGAKVIAIIVKDEE